MCSLLWFVAVGDLCGDESKIDQLTEKCLVVFCCFDKLFNKAKRLLFLFRGVTVSIHIHVKAKLA